MLQYATSNVFSQGKFRLLVFLWWLFFSLCDNHSFVFAEGRVTVGSSRKNCPDASPGHRKKRHIIYYNIIASGLSRSRLHQQVREDPTIAIDNIYSMKCWVIAFVTSNNSLSKKLTLCRLLCVDANVRATCSPFLYSRSIGLGSRVECNYIVSRDTISG